MGKSIARSQIMPLNIRRAISEACVGLIFPLACIWFGDYLGQYTGFMRGHYVSQQTPGCLVVAGGWFFLIGVPVVVYWLSKGL